MPIYHKLGSFPQKRHTQFEKPKGGLYYEQLFGTEGFHGHSSLLYEVHRPTQVKEILNRLHNIQPSSINMSITETQDDTSSNNDRLISETTLSDGNPRKKAVRKTKKSAISII